MSDIIKKGKYKKFDIIYRKNIEIRTCACTFTSELDTANIQQKLM
jgi:hypothetical protein